MHNATRVLLIAAILAPAAYATAAAPEVVRAPGSTASQMVGQLHTLRNIPEACVRVEGVFTGDAAMPYKLEVIPRDPCVQRAVFIEAEHLKAPPSTADHWLLNDRISVPRADAPTCVATVEIWRRPGDTTPPKLDAQGRSRLYLDKPQQPVKLPVFTAVLHPAKAC